MSKIRNIKDEIIEILKESTIQGKKIIISIEGNIGAGKSTIIENIEKILGHEYIEYNEEPVKEWINCQGVNILEKYYTNPSKYAFCFQSVVMSSRMRKQRQQAKTLKIVERSPLSDLCFAKLCKESDFFDDAESRSYISIVDKTFESEINARPDCILYLRCDPKICSFRMNKRGRKEEKEVPLDYLESLHNEHEKLINVALDYNTTYKRIEEEKSVDGKFDNLYRRAMDINIKKYGEIKSEKIPVMIINANDDLTDLDALKNTFLQSFLENLKILYENRKAFRNYTE